MRTRVKIRSFESHTARNIILLVTAALAVAYFFQITLASSRGYELKKLSDHKRALATEMRDLDLQVAQESSAEQLQRRVETLGLQPAGHVQYLSADAHSVAVK